MVHDHVTLYKDMKLSLHERPQEGIPCEGQVVQNLIITPVL